MTGTTISGAGARPSANLTQRIPVSDSGTKGFVTGQQIVELALSYDAGTKTANSPVLNLSETWNNGAVAFTGLKYNVTDTASLAASLLMDLQVGGVSKLTLRKDGFLRAFNTIQTDGVLTWQSDVYLARDAANILAQRNGVNAQAFRLYNTYTDASNYERAFIRWAANQLEIGGEAAGTGLNRNLQITAGADLKLGGGNTVFWRIAGGHLRPESNNAVNLGTASVMVANGYFAGTVQGNAFLAGASASFYWSARSRMFSDADGNIRLSNNGQTDFGRLMFGGTTSSFPALKRNGGVLQVKTADDSDFTRLDAKVLGVVDGMTAPGAVVGYALIFVDAADGDLKVMFGDGTVKTIVTDT